jgi:hypothetical protein
MRVYKVIGNEALHLRIDIGNYLHYRSMQESSKKITAPQRKNHHRSKRISCRSKKRKNQMAGPTPTLRSSWRMRRSSASGRTDACDRRVVSHGRRRWPPAEGRRRPNGRALSTAQRYRRCWDGSFFFFSRAISFDTGVFWSIRLYFDGTV